jgi:hypothetical protein
LVVATAAGGIVRGVLDPWCESWKPVDLSGSGPALPVALEFYPVNINLVVGGGHGCRWNCARGLDPLVDILEAC